MQEIFLGTTILKVCHYADDLTLFISSLNSFSSICEITNEFSLYSGLKFNHSKTSIISISPALLSSFRFFFPQCRVLSCTKILGITFSFRLKDLSKNWEDLIRSLPYSTFANLNRKDSFFSKVIILNQHLLQKFSCYRESSLTLSNNSRLQLLCYLNFYGTTPLLSPLKDPLYTYLNTTVALPFLLFGLKTFTAFL